MKHWLFFFALFFYAEKGCSLKCYDSVSTNGSVLIGCNFPGAACAVTQASYVGYSFIAMETYDIRSYFCAHKETTCKSGLGNFCSKTATFMSALGLMKKSGCSTTCCETDKCNKLPEEPEESHRIIGEMGSLDKIDRDAEVQSPLRCYMNVNKGQQAVDCLFHDAVCVLYKKEVKTPPSDKTSWLGGVFTTTTYYETYQKCGKKAECAERRKALCQTKSGAPISNCDYQCCTSNYCNPLPPSMNYVGDEGPKTGIGDIPDSNNFWNGLLPTTTTIKPVSFRRKKPKGMKLGYDVLTTPAVIVDESPKSPHTIVIVGVGGIVSVIAMIAVIAYKRCKARINWVADKNPLL